MYSVHVIRTMFVVEYHVSLYSLSRLRKVHLKLQTEMRLLLCKGFSVKFQGHISFHFFD